MSLSKFHILEEHTTKGFGKPLTLSQLKEHIIEKARGFEVITGNCVPYIDVDIDYDDEDEQIEKKWDDLKQSYDAVRNRFGSGANIITFESCGLKKKGSKNKWRNSYRFIIRNCGYYKQGIDLPLVKGTDRNVYKAAKKRQLLRLPYCSYPGENRYFKRVIIDGDDDSIKNSYICDTLEECLSTCDDENLSMYLAQNTEGESLRGPAYDSIAGIPIINDNPPVVAQPIFQKDQNITPDFIQTILMGLNVERATEYDKWLKACFAVGGIAKANNLDLEDVLQRWSAQAPNYNEQATRKCYLKADGRTTLGSLMHWLREDNQELYSQIKKHLVQIFEKDTFFQNLFRGDVGHAENFYNDLKDRIRTISEQGEGYFWDKQQKLWIETCSTAIMNRISPGYEKLVKVYLKHFNDIDPDEFDEKDAETIKSLNKTLKYIQSHTGSKNIYAKAKTKFLDTEFPRKLNSVTYLFPISKGRVVNLKTSEIRERTYDDKFSFEIDLDLPEQPNFDNVNKFFNSIFSNDQELISHMQKVFGLFLTGETSNREFYVTCGRARNGKSSLFRILSAALGSNFMQALPQEIFINNPHSNRHAGAHTAHLMPLVGPLRLGYFSESKRNEKLNCALLKAITGGDTLTARAPYEKNNINFKPQTKLMMVTNHRPQFDTDDQAMIDRLVNIPLKERFVENPGPGERQADESFIDFICNDRTELGNFLMWFIQGAKRFYEEGLADKPEAIKKDIKKAILNSDFIEQYLTDEWEVDKNRKDWNKVSSSELRADYLRWTRDNGGPEYVQREFTQRMKNKGFEIKRTTSCMIVIGIKRKDICGS
jgi:P4 family phage/plasmid primase-like protien